MTARKKNFVDAFLAERPRLLGLAYRMLASASEAEDVLQDAYLRVQGRSDVAHPRAYLTKVVTHLALDRLRADGHREYVGPWLPEPIADEPDPEATALQRESLRYAFLRLLQETNPRERAAYLLREVYQHDYAELAEWLGESEANCRQLVSRARKHLEAGRGRYPARPEQADALLRALLRGDLEDLKSRLAQDVAFWSDGGGKVAAALHPLFGAETVGKLLLGLLRKAGSDLRWEHTQLNGGPAVLLYWQERLETVAFLEMDSSGICSLCFQRNPDKLTNLEG